MNLSLMRFHGMVSVREIRDVVTNTMIKNPDPPIEAVALIDTRDAKEYDSRFVEVLGFAGFLRSIFLPTGHELRIIILTKENWKYGMAHMFAMAAQAAPGISVKMCETESEMMQLCGFPEETLDNLFRPQDAFYTSTIASHSP